MIGGKTIPSRGWFMTLFQPHEFQTFWVFSTQVPPDVDQHSHNFLLLTAIALGDAGWAPRSAAQSAAGGRGLFFQRAAGERCHIPMEACDPQRWVANCVQRLKLKRLTNLPKRSKHIETGGCQIAIAHAMEGLIVNSEWHLLNDFKVLIAHNNFLCSPLGIHQHSPDVPWMGGLAQMAPGKNAASCQGWEVMELRMVQQHFLDHFSPKSEITYRIFYDTIWKIRKVYSINLL